MMQSRWEHDEKQEHDDDEEEEEEEEDEEEEEVNRNNVGVIGGYVKVMTDDQLETLRKQISVYATICEQLVQMHKTLTSHPDLPGVRLYCDPQLMTSVGQKMSGRQRWTPTPLQLQILERIFSQGNGTPTKQKIKDITSELGHHGQISETNVYNWFQNRRARSKRKHHNNNNNPAAESELELDTQLQVQLVDSPNDKKTRPPSQSQSQDICFPHNVSSDLHFFHPQTTKPESIFPSNAPSANFPQIPFYDSLISTQRNEQFDGKMEVSGGSYTLYEPPEDYNING